MVGKPASVSAMKSARRGAARFVRRSGSTRGTRPVNAHSITNHNLSQCRCSTPERNPVREISGRRRCNNLLVATDASKPHYLAAHTELTGEKRFAVTA
jgi:hypothetical protein